jgi:branched-chain amino acid transport system ATP-binding protein
MSLLRVKDLELRFGELAAFQDVTFEVGEGELLAVIGPNGAGKTSLFNVLSRVYRPTAGGVWLGERDLLSLRASQLAGIGVARTFQNLGLFAHLSVLENVLIGRHHLMRAGTLRAGLWWGFAAREERRHRAQAMQTLEFVGISDLAATPVQTLPYGLQKRVELARALTMEPRLLMLDEPVAGMGADERSEMTELVRRVHGRGITVLLVEHDMGMVMEVAQRVLVLDYGRVIACGSPGEVQRDEQVIRAYLGQELAEPAGAAGAG